MYSPATVCCWESGRINNTFGKEQKKISIPHATQAGLIRGSGGTNTLHIYERERGFNGVTSIAGLSMIQIILLPYVYVSRDLSVFVCVCVYVSSLGGSRWACACHHPYRVMQFTDCSSLATRGYRPKTNFWTLKVNGSHTQSVSMHRENGLPWASNGVVFLNSCSVPYWTSHMCVVSSSEIHSTHVCSSTFLTSPPPGAQPINHAARMQLCGVDVAV